MSETHLVDPVTAATERVAKVRTAREYGRNIPPGQLADLLEIVAQETGFTKWELRCPWRDRPLLRARMMFYFAARVLTTKSLPQIAEFICRNHSTVLHGAKCVHADRQAFEPEISRIIDRHIAQRVKKP